MKVTAIFFEHRVKFSGVFSDWQMDLGTVEVESRTTHSKYKA